MRILIIILFVVALAAFPWLTRREYRDRIETSLEEKTQAILDQNPDWKGVKVRFNYLDGELSGEVADVAQLSGATRAVEGNLTIGRVRDCIRVLNTPSSEPEPPLPPTPKPEEKKAEPPFLAGSIKDGIIVLSGQLSSEISRYELLNRTRSDFPGLKVVDQIEVKDLVLGSDWESRFSDFNRAFFNLIEEGSYQFKDGVFRLEGIVQSQQQFQQLHMAAIETAGRDGRSIEDEKLEINTTSSPPSLVVTLEPNRIVLIGQVSDRIRRDAIVEAAKSADTGLPISNRIQVKPQTLKSAWLDRVPGYVTTLVRVLKSGQLTITDDEALLSGAVESAEARAAIQAELRTVLGEDGVVQGDLTIETSPNLADEHLSELSIFFDLKSTKIESTEQRDKVKKAASILLEEAPEKKLIVAGHAESKGELSTNAWYAKTRAKAVYEALLEAGVPSGQLVQHYYHTNEDKKPGLTDEDRANLRRVDLYLEGSERTPENLR